VLDIETGIVQYCNAGHNPPLVITRAGSVDFVKVPCGFVVGVMENIKCERQELKLSACDTIFLYTDGITEAMNPDRQQFSESRLRECLLKFKGQDIKAVINAMRQEVAVFAQDAPQSDDITMLAVRYKGAAPC
jgi:sigma-B regulation protein RsbU (phosphoserine phosphatase)